MVFFFLFAAHFASAFTPGTTRRRNAADNFDYRSELTAARARYGNYLIRSAAAWRRALYGGTDAPSGDAAVRKAAETWAAFHGGGRDMPADEASHVRERAALEALLSRATDSNVQVESLGGAPLPREDVLMRLAPLQSGYRASTGRGGPQAAPNDPKADAYLAKLQLPWIPEALSRVTLPDPRLQAALHPGAPDLNPPYIRPDLLQAPGERGDIALPHMPWPMRSSLDAGAGWGSAGWGAPLPAPAGPDGRPPMLPPGGYPYAAESLPWAGVPRLNLPALAGQRFADAGADTAATLAVPWVMRGRAAAGAGEHVDVLARLSGVGSGLSPALLAAAGAARDGAAAADATGRQGAALNRFLGLTDGEAGAMAAAASADAEAASRAAAAFPGLLLQGSAAAPAEARSLAPAAANAWMHAAAARQAAVGAAAADLASFASRRQAAADSALAEQLATNRERAEALQHRIPRDEEQALAVEQQRERRTELAKEGGAAAAADADAESLGFRVPTDAATLAVDASHHNAGKGVDLSLLAGLPPRVRRECEANPSLALCLDPAAAAAFDKAQAAAEEARRWQGPAPAVKRAGLTPEVAAAQDAANIANAGAARSGAIEAALDGGGAAGAAGGKRGGGGRLRKQAAA